MGRRSSRFPAELTLLVLLPALGSCSGDQIGNDNIPPPHDVDIVQGAWQLGPNAFSPPNTVISLASQDTVSWYNADFTIYGGASGATHHLKSDDGTTFDSADISPNGVFQATFTAPGTYTYHCEIHPEMTGTVTVDP